MIIFSCLIMPASANKTTTYNKDIAPIVYKQCISCHRTDEVAPFSLMTYQDAKKRAKQLALVTQKRTMPPWKLEQGYGAFKHERRLTDVQIATIQRWAESGAPEGNPADLPPRPQFKDGWQLGKPDLVLTMPKAFTIPAEGKDINRSFPLQIRLPADKYIRAIEFRPGNRRVVHHATLMMDKTGKAIELERQQGGAGAGYVSFGGPGFLPAGGLPGYAPGMSAEVFPPDAAAVLPKEIDLVFGMHYHPIGKQEVDQSRVGLYFTDKPPTRISSLVMLGVQNIDIEAGDKNHREKASYTLPVDVDITSLYQHMHLIGKSCKLWAELLDGRIVPLIKINDWDFNWQSTYHTKDLIHLPKGTKLQGEWTHDNSAENIHNPNQPPKRVKNGENSTDEMAGVLIYVYVRSDSDNGTLWITNLVELGKASITPPQRQGKETKTPLLGLLYEGIGKSLVGLTKSPLPTLGALLFLFILTPWAILLFSMQHFRNLNNKTVNTLTKLPFRSFFTGLFLLLGTVIFTLSFLLSTNSVAQFFTILVLTSTFPPMLLGMGGLTLIMGKWLSRKDNRDISFGMQIKSSLLLVFSFLIPYVGWFLIAPLLITAALGAGTLALWESGATQRRMRGERLTKRQVDPTISGSTASL
ncbi:hypothetical protein [Armatimonas sp.]|uniref:hypothetical protein n=1 Tax=Armatimonas sp. TaxID=1872638 RepID=UPI00286CABD0|nr:hypothetical protein [Armatimonas sp.]